MATRSLGQLTLDLVAKIGAFTGPLEKAKRTAKSEMTDISKSVKAASGAVLGIGAAASGAATAVIAFTKNAADNARELKNQSSLANSSVEQFQRMGYAASTVGIEQEKLSDILKDVNDRVGDFMATGGGPMADFFNNIAPQVGVTADQFRYLSGPQALQLYYDSLEKANLNQQDMTFYMEAMASDVTALIPLLRNGGAELKTLGDQADQMGIVLSGLDVEKLADFASQFDRTHKILGSLANLIAAELAPYLSTLNDRLVDAAGGAGNFQGAMSRAMRMSVESMGPLLDAFQEFRRFDAQVKVATAQMNLAFADFAQGAWESFSWFIDTAINGINNLIRGMNAIPGFTDLDLIESSMTNSAYVEGFRQRAADMKDTLEQYRGELQEISDQPLPSKAITDYLNDVDAKLAAFRAEQDGIPIKSLDEWLFKPPSKRTGIDNKPAEKALKDALSSYESLRSKFDEVGAAEAEFAKQTKELDLLLAAGKITQDQYGDAAAYLREELAQTQQTATGMSSELQGLLDKLDPVSASSRQYAADLALLTRNGELTAETMERLKEAYQSTQTASEAYGQGFGAEIGSRGGIGAPTDPDQQDEWQTWLESARDAFTDFDNLNRQVAEDFTSRFGDAIEGVVFDYENLGDAAQGVAEGMARSVVNALGQMAAQWLAYQVVQMTVGRTTQATAGMQMAANAQAQSVMAGLNAFTSTAAIPIIGPELAPVAASTAVAATQPMAATVGTLALSGMAHDGIDAVPADGTWFLQQGERVTTSETSAKLDHTLDNIQARMSEPGQTGSAMMGSPTIHVDARGASDPAAVRRAAEQGAEMGYRRVFEDVRTNGPIRRKLGV